MDNTQGVAIAVGIGFGLAVMYGIYRLIMRRFSASNTLRSGTAGADVQQAVKAIFTVIVTILIFAGIYFIYDYFVHQGM